MVAGMTYSRWSRIFLRRGQHELLGRAHGRQVTEEGVRQWQSLLDEGTSVEFNAMFMDRYLWNRQFRGSGWYPRLYYLRLPLLTGVKSDFSRYTPEADEAMELITQLHDDRFTYIVFKPALLFAQIRQVLNVRRKLIRLLIMEVEGSAAGGHHS